jgi:hypothetical protein
VCFIADKEFCIDILVYSNSFRWHSILFMLANLMAVKYLWMKAEIVAMLDYRCNIPVSNSVIILKHLLFDL